MPSYGRMVHSLMQYKLLERFACLGADCPDTCCHGWEMPADARQLALYEAKAPELVATINKETGSMCRDSATGYCQQLSGGLCATHAKYGPDFLGDACYFYPKMVHHFAGHHTMTAAMSCPEVVRLMLVQPDPFTLRDVTVERMPVKRSDLLPDGMAQADAQAIMDACMAMVGDTSQTPEAALVQLVHAMFQLSDTPLSQWATRLPALVTNRETHSVETKSSDPVMLYYALSLLLAFGDAIARPRLAHTMAVIEETLDCRFIANTREINASPQTGAHYQRLVQRWKMDAHVAMAPVLRRWLQGELAMTAFPFGGFAGITLAQKAAVLVQRFATVKLALMCHVQMNGTPPDEETVIRVIQSLSRFMDHIADAELTLMIHRDAGWTSEARVLGLI